MKRERERERVSLQRKIYKLSDIIFILYRCPGHDYAIKSCGKGEEGGCGALFDFTSSIVSVAPKGSKHFSLVERDDRIKDNICSSLPAEKYMTEVTEESMPYWNSFSVNPPWLYFGSENG